MASGKFSLVDAQVDDLLHHSCSPRGLPQRPAPFCSTGVDEPSWHSCYLRSIVSALPVSKGTEPVVIHETGDEVSRAKYGSAQVVPKRVLGGGTHLFFLSHLEDHQPVVLSPLAHLPTHTPHRQWDAHRICAMIPAPPVEKQEDAVSEKSL